MRTVIVHNGLIRFPNFSHVCPSVVALDHITHGTSILVMRYPSTLLVLYIVASNEKSGLVIVCGVNAKRYWYIVRIHSWSVHLVWVLAYKGTHVRAPYALADKLTFATTTLFQGPFPF